MSIRECIQSADDLDASPTSITFQIATMTGQNISITLNKSDSIKMVKQKIFEYQGIPIDSQILVFREKECNRNETILSDLGVKSGSTLQLVLRMNGGPSNIVKQAPTQENSILLLFCKQNEDMFMLELKLDDKNGDLPRAEQLYLLMKETTGIDLFEDFNQDYLDKESLDENETKFISKRRHRQGTGDSTTFSSYFSINESIESRPLSGSSSLIYSNLSRIQSAVSKIPKEELPKTPKGYLRPATAISIMRLKSGSTNHIVVPKSRPCSAVRLSDMPHSTIEQFISISPLPNSDPIHKESRKLKKKSQPESLIQLSSFDHIPEFNDIEAAFSGSFDIKTARVIKSIPGKEPKKNFKRREVVTSQDSKNTHQSID